MNEITEETLRDLSTDLWVALVKDPNISNDDELRLRAANEDIFAVIDKLAALADSCAS